MTNRSKKWISRLFWSAIIPGTVALFVGVFINKSKNKSQLVYAPYQNARNVSLTSGFPNFEKASAITTPCVVFIKTVSTVQYSHGGWFWDFDPFGSRGQSTSTGSGVILSKDGYIVTNNHVIDGANKITVVLNDNAGEYEAKLIGADPSSDLAVLKIEAKDLSPIAIANSDDVNVGSWVLAVGNPFNLTSTVTAGIVSAKGRNINIVKNQFPIESFIQTDAAINPGNSGGALVNDKGELVGINTAIQSQTGSYSGYGFAIPSNVVAKIANDFMQFGALKKAYSSFEVRDMTAGEKQKTKDFGVIVTQVLAEGKAEKAGIIVGDVIGKIDGKIIKRKSDFDEILAYHRPQDRLIFTLIRNADSKELTMELMSKDEYESIVDKGLVYSKVLGAGFQSLTEVDTKKFGVKAGVKVRKINEGGAIANMGLSEGFIITSFNGRAYIDPAELIASIESSKRGISITGLTASGQRSTFSFY